MISCIGVIVDIRDKDAECGGIVLLSGLTVVAEDVYCDTTTLAKDGAHYVIPFNGLYSDEASDYCPYALVTDLLVATREIAV